MLAGAAAGQSPRLITQWYDSARTQLKSRFFVDDAGRPEGRYEHYHRNGLLAVRGTYERHLPGGLWRYRHDNGRLRMEGQLFRGRPRGNWRYYDRGGHLLREGHWADGRQTGVWRFYDGAGRLQQRGELDGGTRVGRWESFHPDGTTAGVTLYQHDLGPESLGRYQGYYASGAKRAEGWRRDERSDSLWRYYHENGTLAAEGRFEEGQRVGEWRYYHPDGTPSAAGAYVGGHREGTWQMFRPDGQPLGRGEFEGGDGTYEAFHPNGQLRVRGQYAEDVPVGTWTYYHPDGWREGEAEFYGGVGRYVGYYPDGKLRTEGHVEGEDRVGQWVLYTTNGLIDGYYEAYAGVVSFDTLRPAVKPAISLRRRRLHYFRPRVNELRTVIVSTNPLATAFGQLPLAVEYYLEERQGFEVRALWIRNPFYYAPSDAWVNRPFRSGFAVDFRHKFYHPARQLGSWYFGYEMRYTRQQHQAFVTDSLLSANTRLLGVEEQRYTFGLLLGTRRTWKLNGFNLTADAFAGLGAGYRSVRRDWPEQRLENWERVFRRLDGDRAVFPLRLGFTVGYYF
ncbi:MAG: hypothetical protein WBA12_11705 [Catalinimonas sp.]